MKIKYKDYASCVIGERLNQGSTTLGAKQYCLKLFPPEKYPYNYPSKGDKVRRPKIK